MSRPHIASDEDTVHRFSPSSFKLQSLPVPRAGQVLGLNPPDWNEILHHFKGTELHNYFTHVIEDNLKATIKSQYIYCMTDVLQGNVGQLLSRRDDRDMKQELAADLDLIKIMDRNLGYLSGGELQSYVIVVEHDLSVLDYLSDFICFLYGKPGIYGAVTLPFSVREGINIFLAGFVPTENLRLRDESLTLKVAETPHESEEEIETRARYKYPTMTLAHGRTFRLKVVEGEFTDSQIIVLLGENGTGKTTFLEMPAGLLEPSSVRECDVEIPKFNVSYKPQRFATTNEYTVRSMFLTKICHSCMDPQFVSDVMEPLSIEKLMDKKLANLSWGELHKVALTYCLGKPADIYLIDELSTYLNSEQRIVASKVIKKFILRAKKTAFVVEHDFTMATYLADRVIVCEGKTSIDCVADSPQSVLTEMNQFLSHLDVTHKHESIDGSRSPLDLTIIWMTNLQNGAALWVCMFE
ncbi:hypothetical protein SASPL_139333 [Salvia splendens]|uniref:ABC transporter domain-containing protein n=1 Tax=Salvia splendens TaxID=180675 RepID=A0A8X8WMR5_SALSN|nr:hypothetical protein SASPL_139333 [Salvia splendens]